MTTFRTNVIIVLLATAALVAFVWFVEIPVFGGWMSKPGVWLVPGFVGFVLGVALRGSVVVKVLSALPMYPAAMLTVRHFLIPEPPRDAESDAFLVIYTIGLTVYVVVVVAATAAGGLLYRTRASRTVP